MGCIRGRRRSLLRAWSWWVEKGGGEFQLERSMGVPSMACVWPPMHRKIVKIIFLFLPFLFSSFFFLFFLFFFFFFSLSFSHFLSYSLLPFFMGGLASFFKEYHDLPGSSLGYLFYSFYDSTVSLHGPPTCVWPTPTKSAKAGDEAQGSR